MHAFKLPVVILSTLSALALSGCLVGDYGDYEEDDVTLFAGDAAFLCNVGTNATKTVSSASGLRSALSSAQRGHTIVIKSGTYSGDFTLSKSGTASQPITIRAQGTVRFNDSVFTLAGNFAVLTGMTFNNGMVTIKGDNNRVTRNVFQNGKTGGNSSKLHSAVHTEGAASNNRIDHNEVRDWLRRAIRNTKLKSGTRNNRFDYNYLHDMVGVRGNSGEAFQVGTGGGDPAFTPRTVIEFNLVDNHDLEGEIISLKSNGNTVRANTFLNSPRGNVNSRTGSNNLFKNNTLINVKSLKTYGDDNEVIGNAFENADLLVPSGDAVAPELLLKNSNGSLKFKGAHPAGRNTTVAGNRFSRGGLISLGKKGTGKITYNRTFAAKNTLLAENSGGQIRIDGKVEGTRERAKFDGSIGSPVRMRPSQVGPSAADPLCD